MRGVHSGFQRYSVYHRARTPPHSLFSGGDDGMPSGHNEVSPRRNGSSHIHGSVGFVEPLNAVSGSSAGRMIDPKETQNNPRITIVQRICFTETTPLPYNLPAPT